MNIFAGSTWRRRRVFLLFPMDCVRVREYSYAASSRVGPSSHESRMGTIRKTYTSNQRKTTKDFGFFSLYCHCDGATRRYGVVPAFEADDLTLVKSRMSVMCPAYEQASGASGKHRPFLPKSGLGRPPTTAHLTSSKCVASRQGCCYGRSKLTQA